MKFDILHPRPVGLGLLFNREIVNRRRSAARRVTLEDHPASEDGRSGAQQGGKVASRDQRADAPSSDKQSRDSDADESQTAKQGEEDGKSDKEGKDKKKDKDEENKGDENKDGDEGDGDGD